VPAPQDVVLRSRLHPQESMGSLISYLEVDSG